LREFTSWADWVEFFVMMSAGFGEPLAYSLRIRQILRHRRADFDIIHDNQCLGNGIFAALTATAGRMLETLHHPITVDRSIALDHADERPAEAFHHEALVRLLFGMQVRVAPAAAGDC
jgi:hypothetical protein